MTSTSAFSNILTSFASLSPLINDCDSGKLDGSLRKNPLLVKSLVEYVEQRLVSEIIAATEDSTSHTFGNDMKSVYQDFVSIIVHLCSILGNMKLVQREPGIKQIILPVLSFPCIILFFFFQQKKKKKRSLDCHKSVRETICGKTGVKNEKMAKKWPEYFSCGKSAKSSPRLIRSFYHCNVLYEILNRKHPTPDQGQDASKTTERFLEYEMWPRLIQQWTEEFSHVEAFEGLSPIAKLYWVRHVALVCKLLTHTQIPASKSIRTSSGLYKVTPLQRYVLYFNNDTSIKNTTDVLVTNFWLILTDCYADTTQPIYELTAIDEIDHVLTQALQEVVDTYVSILTWLAGSESGAEQYWDAFFDTFAARDALVLKELFLGEKIQLRRAFRQQIAKFRAGDDFYSVKVEKSNLNTYKRQICNQ
ncbi:hypothetical protein RFI_03856 [Reticulomyxa filosa]|uniref:Uncharacterized protein n=1 Tax=Reticulomyxa filosa TaxID=46433 RepID=X6P3X1_RETFI|nr:hypothetical protein RFI_03856 [Reticulomyxa filosa]|eukprot:ETO33250.1 hypothetical protein RFI_03856 [Reticulomyxa filosa]